MEWRIYYADGSTYSDCDGSPYDAPAYGVLVIVRNDPLHGRILLSDCHYYCWRDGEWFGVGRTDGLNAGLVEYIAQASSEHPTKVIFGYTVTNPAFDVVMKRAMADEDFAPKSAAHRIERFNHVEAVG